MTTTEKTVRDIAIEHPSGIRVFESLGIDYCCGGRISLPVACANAGITLDRVLDLLAASESETHASAPLNWDDRPVSALIAHIVDEHHAFVRAEVPRLRDLLAKVVAKHGPAHPELTEVQQIFGALGQELLTHLQKEEQILFPYIGRLEHRDGGPLPAACFGSVSRPVAAMVAEHEDAGALLSRLRELSAGYTAPAEACPSFVALYHGLAEFERDLHQHIHLENNILFPRAIELEAR